MLVSLLSITFSGLNAFEKELRQEKEQSWGGTLEKRERQLHQEKSQIEDDMVHMAQSMKELANGFTQQFKSDKAMLSTISNQQDTSLTKTLSEVDELQKFRGSIVTGFFGRLFMLIFALGVFCFMLVFIRLFPSQRIRLMPEPF
jgi:hypothetical protein